MSHLLRFLTLPLLLVLGTQRPVFAQDVSAKLGVARTLHSTLLNEDRRVLVHLPTSYDTSGRSYPVLYLLDGTPAFLLEMIAITNRLRNDGNAPEMIIVAIENSDRNRDMMPVVAKGFLVRHVPRRSLAFWRRNPFGDRQDLSHGAATDSAGQVIKWPIHHLRAARETNRIQCVRCVQRRLVCGEQRVLHGNEHPSIRNSGIVFTPTSLHGELAPGSKRS